jgi:tetratricopeptide (TPR) repeat protein
LTQARTPFVALLLSGLLAGAALAANPPATPITAVTATERKRELADSFFGKAEACWDKRDLACALENVRKALITDPDMLLAQVLLGRVLLAGGNAAGAEAAVERAFKLGIDPGELAPTLAEAQLLQGKHRALLTDARLDPARYAAGVQRHLSLIRARAGVQPGVGQQCAVLALQQLGFGQRGGQLAGVDAQLEGALHRRLGPGGIATGQQHAAQQHLGQQHVGVGDQGLADVLQRAGQVPLVPAGFSLAEEAVGQLALAFGGRDGRNGRCRRVGGERRARQQAAQQQRNEGRARLSQMR